MKSFLQLSKKAWRVYCKKIIRFFQQSLEKDHHLLVFKNAILCGFLKSDKYYQVLPRFY